MVDEIDTVEFAEGALEEPLSTKRERVATGQRFLKEMCDGFQLVGSGIALDATALARALLQDNRNSST